jgi:oligoribonuclease NrnB/cAMP/cGMP phosphodiesterase (DHH superfamily)
MKNFVIYHGCNCLDGLASAWCFYRNFKDNAVYIPQDYKNITLFEYSKGDNIFILDFSFPYNILEEMCNKANVYLADHHDSFIRNLLINDFCPAEEVLKIDLNDIPPYYKRLPLNFKKLSLSLDNSSSGCTLSWELSQEYFGEKENQIPDILYYIEDYDLWKFQFPLTKNINYGLQSYELDLQNFDRITQYFQTDESNLIIDGEVFKRILDKQLKSIIKNVRYIDFEEYSNIPIINCTSNYTNDISELINKNFLFCITYYDNKHGTKYSLRSQKTSPVNLGELAERFGGGGHKTAAAFFLSHFEKEIHNAKWKI